MKPLCLLILMMCTIPVQAQKSDSIPVYFDFDKYTIRTEQAGKLKTLSAQLTGKKPLSISIYGHCDSSGSNAYNNALSLKRAAAVKRFMLSQGIEASLIKSSTGFGELQQRYGNDSQNRRVDIVFTYEKIRRKQQDSSSPFNIDTLEAGSTVVLENLNFYPGMHVLLPKSRPVLESLLRIMQNNPALEIEIQGHVCCVSPEQDGFDQETYTHDLSVNRAKAVYNYLIYHRISSARLSYKGFGGKFHLYPDDTEAHKSANRRVEIKIIKK